MHGKYDCECKSNDHDVAWQQSKVPHKDPSETTKFAMYLCKIYIKITVYHGNILNYFGMTMDYSMDGQVSVSMGNHTNKIL